MKSKHSNKAAAATNKAVNVSKTPKPQQPQHSNKGQQHGVIASFMQLLRDAAKSRKAFTSSEYATMLHKQFGKQGHELTGLGITVRAQLSRLPKERDFGIVKERDGRIVRYAAASAK